MKQLKDGFGWAVVESNARSLRFPLADYYDERSGEVETVGTYYASIYFTAKAAREAARRWGGAKVVKVRLSRYTGGAA